MDMASYIDTIKFQLTGGVLDCELTDESFQKIIMMALREIQRYINTTKIVTLPYKECLDLSDFRVSSVYRVYRAQGYLSSNSQNSMDPMYMAQWQLLSGMGTGLDVSNFTYRYGAWNTMLQIRNTTSTDLTFIYDKTKNYLYINCAYDKPSQITIEYVPIYEDVSQIVSDYWIDKLCKLSLALAKVTLGRIRSKFTQSNALWTLDGPQLLEEGNNELNSIREELVRNNNQMHPID